MQSLFSTLQRGSEFWTLISLISQNVTIVLSIITSLPPSPFLPHTTTANSVQREVTCWLHLLWMHVGADKSGTTLVCFSAAAAGCCCCCCCLGHAVCGMRATTPPLHTINWQSYTFRLASACNLKYAKVIVLKGEGEKKIIMLLLSISDSREVVFQTITSLRDSRVIPRYLFVRVNTTASHVCEQFLAKLNFYLICA